MRWPVAAGTELTGEFVRLIRVDPVAHAPGLFAALDAPEVWTHFGAPRPTDAGQLLGGLNYLDDQPDRHLWIVLAATAIGGFPAGTVLGMSSYFDVSEHNARLEIGATAYNPLVWSTAVNPETKSLLLRHAFETLNCARVQFRTDSRNERSRRAILGIGATFEGILHRYERRVDGTLRDTALYSITAQQWPAVEQRLLGRTGAFSTARP